VTRYQSLRLIVRELFAQRKASAFAGLVLGSATVLAGMALLGLSGWFISATAIAGLSISTAIIFDVFSPSAGIRLLALGRTFGRYGERISTHDATLGMVANIREKLFRGWARPEAALILLRHPARLLFRLTADADALEAVYLRLFVPLAAAVCATLAASITLALIHPLLGLFLLSALITVGGGVLVLASRNAVKHARRSAHMLEVLRARTIDLVAGQTEYTMTANLFRQKDAIIAAENRLGNAHHALNQQETGVTAAFTFATSLILAVILMGIAELHAQGQVSVPVAALALLVAFAALEPFAALRRGAVELGRTLNAAQRLAPRLVEEKAESQPSHNGFSIDLRNVRIPARLHNVSLEVAQGERVALVGPSGAGKSTLLAVIAHELGFESGHVAAQSACLMTQNSELFQDTLRENLTLASPGAPDEKLWQALVEAGLAHELRAMGRDLDAPLGEGGLGLSQGQARRLALARLVLRDAPVWLLDEPTESVDAATAIDVLARLKLLAAGKTLLIATHMRREAELCDRIIAMNGKQIMEDYRRGEREFEKTLVILKSD
jgi:ATP-binding cassette subfamily C protein CydC